jgi:Ca-activated chloride channel family protein
LEAIRLSGNPDAPSKELKDEVIRLSQQYGILTPYTSYLILEEGDRRPVGTPGIVAAPAARGALRDALSRQAAGGAAGGRANWRLGGPEAGEAPVEQAREELRSAEKSLRAESGAAGVAGGRAVGSLKLGESESVDSFYGLINRSESRVKQVGSRAFYLQGERWVEGGLLENELASARRIAYLSDGYFALLSKNAGIGELLGVGPKVTFRFGGETIAIE